MLELRGPPIFHSASLHPTQIVVVFICQRPDISLRVRSGDEPAVAGGPTEMCLFSLVGSAYTCQTTADVVLLHQMLR